MNQEIKAKWIEALRGGEYQQGKGFLKSKEGFCCLGVLCDVYSKETGQGKWSERRPGDNADFYFQSHCATLPEEVEKWADLPYGANGPTGIKSRDEDRYLTLVDLNDGLKLTFDQIADVIQYAF